jgi:hypothetical protein
MTEIARLVTDSVRHQQSLKEIAKKESVTASTSTSISMRRMRLNLLAQ